MAAGPPKGSTNERRIENGEITLRVEVTGDGPTSSFLRDGPRTRTCGGAGWITCRTPDYTDDLVPVTYSANDGAGVGVDTATLAVKLDGVLVSDTCTLNAGLHTIAVTVADKLGNDGTSTTSFRVRATAASLQANLARAIAEGKVTNPGARKGLTTIIGQAQTSHLRGRHDVEANQLGAFINLLRAKAGNGMDATVANRLIGLAQDLIASGG